MTLSRCACKRVRFCTDASQTPPLNKYTLVVGCTGENFMQWFKALLDKLKQPSLIIMDNASYHTCLPSTAPKNIHKMAKDDIRALLEKKGVPTDASDLREVLMHRLKAWRDANIPPAVVSAAREKGHEVLFTPPRMCELQPIERVFGIVKGRIGRRHHAGIDYSKTKDMLVEEVSRVHRQKHRDGQRTLIQAVIDSSYREADRYKEQLDRCPARRELDTSTTGAATVVKTQQQAPENGIKDQDEDDDDSDEDWEFDETDEECSGDNSSSNGESDDESDDESDARS